MIGGGDTLPDRRASADLSTSTAPDLPLVDSVANDGSPPFSSEGSERPEGASRVMVYTATQLHGSRHALQANRR